MNAHKAHKNTIGIWNSTDKVCYDNAKTAVKKYNIIKLTEKALPLGELPTKAGERAIFL